MIEVDMLWMVTGGLFGLMIGMMVARWTAIQWRKSIEEIHKVSKKYMDAVDKIIRSYER